MRTYILKPGRQIIGRAGEMNETAVAVNIAKWLEDYPAGIPQLMVTMPGGQRIPLTVTVEDGLMVAVLPDTVTVGPGLYVYTAVMTNGPTQVQTARFECIIMGSELAQTWKSLGPRVPDWAERIFVAADVIERAMDGAIEARTTAVDAAASAEASAEAAADSEGAAALSAQAAAASASDAQDILDNVVDQGAAQVSAIQEAVAAARESIPETYTQLSDDVSDLKSAVVVLEPITKTVTSKNLIDPNGVTVGQLTSGGTVNSSKTSYKTSDYIPLEGGKTYLFAREKLSAAEGYIMGYSGYGVYDTSKTWVSDSLVWENNTADGLTISPQSDCYIRVCGAKDFFTDDTTARFIVQEGTTLNGWEAWFAPYKALDIEPDDIVGGENIEAIADVTATQSQINLYDKSLAVDGKYINAGSVVTFAGWAYTGLIPVKPNTQYCISPGASAPLEMKTSVYAYGSDKSYIGTITLKSYVYKYLLAFTTGATTHYIAVNFSKDSHTTQEFNDTFDTVMLCYGTQRPATYSAYNTETVVSAGKLSDAYFNPDVFAGKKWLACGTSITWYDSKTYSAGLHTGDICRGYVGNVARRKGLLVTNEGISGSTLAGTGSSALIQRYQSLDWANANIATLEYGVNDFGNAIAIGTADDEAGTDTFAACLKTIIEYALTQNPKLCLVICTEPDVRGSTANSGGHYLYEYTDVTLAIAKQYRLPVCDWYYHSGINAVTKGSSSVDYLTADGTHPNDAGHLRMGAMLNQVFDSLIC